MKKKSFNSSSLTRKKNNVIIIIVTLLSVLMPFRPFAAPASAYSQTINIDLNVKNTSLIEILNTIENSSEFLFIFNKNVLNTQIMRDISVKGVRIEHVLDQLFADIDIEYRIDDRQVFLYKKANPVIENIAEMLNEQQPPQRIEITGIVRDESRMTLPGVSVIVKGTQIGTITDINGNFSLSIPADARFLRFSFVGMKTLEVAIEGRTSFNVVLEEDITTLQEVVAVAYGTQRRESVIGAISSVDPEQLEQSSSASLGVALAGRVSGLTSLQRAGGQPGRDDPVLYLRGLSTLNDNAPLVIIDGVPRDNIRQIDPREIESISVLKDASATAVFGVRGANGAIIITTKRGSDSPGKITVNVEQGFSAFTHEPTFIPSVQFMELQNEASMNDGTGLVWNEEIINKFRDPLANLDPNHPNYEAERKKLLHIYPNNDWYRMVISRWSPETRVNAGLRGGTDVLAYYVNTGFIHQGGNFNVEPNRPYDPSPSAKRHSFRGNVDYKPSKNFNTFLNLSTYIEQRNQPGASSTLGTINNAMHTWPMDIGPLTLDGYGAPPGQIIDVPHFPNHSYETVSRRGYEAQTLSVLNSTIGGDWNLSDLITPGLSLNGMVSFDSYTESSLRGHEKELVYDAIIDYENDDLTYALSTDPDIMLNFNKSEGSRYVINAQIKLNYTRLFGKHRVGGLLLAQRDYWEAWAGDIPYNVIGTAARATYDYDTRYFGEVNVGYNGSEQFAPNNRFGFFPAASVGWVATNENFLRNNPILTHLRFRASYGKVGSDRMGSARFLYLDNIMMGSGRLPSLGRGRGINQGLLGNPNIGWEEAVKLNVGSEFSLIDRLSVSLDYFTEHRSNILITRGMVPSIQGIPLSNIPRVNLGEVESQGYEIEASYRQNIGSDFTFNISGNFSSTRNEVTYSDEPRMAEGYMTEYRTQGHPIGQQFGYLIDWDTNGGYWTSQEEIDNSGLTYDFGSPRPGDFIYLDLNGDGIINDQDRVPIGYSSSVPGRIFGLTLNATFKSFDFMAFFQGVVDYWRYYAGEGIWDIGKSGMFYEGFQTKAWTYERWQQGEEITHPALSVGRTVNHVQNDFFIMNRSYVRLRNIELGYNLPEKALTALGGISKLRIYVGGQNLFTWHNLRMTHLDPENESPTQYPQTKIINFGLYASF